MNFTALIAAIAVSGFVFAVVPAVTQDIAESAYHEAAPATPAGAAQL